MIDKNKLNTAPEKSDIAGMLMSSLMVILTLVFVILYAAAFSGKLDPLKDNTTLLYLEPIIFILMGYYFGRLPSLQKEKSLQDETVRQTQKTDAVQYAKEKAQMERETLEEKIKNARIALRTIAPPTNSDASSIQSKAVKTAISILDS